MTKAMHTLTGSSEHPTTRWALVIAAGDAQRKEAQPALVPLCEKYWYPLYADSLTPRCETANNRHGRL